MEPIWNQRQQTMRQQTMIGWSQFGIRDKIWGKIDSQINGCNPETDECKPSKKARHFLLF
jgi:hypothetical protein